LQLFFGSERLSRAVLTRGLTRKRRQFLIGSHQNPAIRVHLPTLSLKRAVVRRRDPNRWSGAKIHKSLRQLLRITGPGLH
jgi:hypothetical protein